MTTFMLLVPCMWILTSATSIQQEDSRTLAQCVDSFHDCVSQTKTTGNSKLRQALEILKSLDDKDMKALDALEIQLLKDQVNILELNMLPSDKDTLGEEENPITIVEKDQYSIVEISKSRKSKDVEVIKKRTQENPAFTVELSSGRSIGHEAPLTFDNIIIDEGENFIPHLGLYRVPESGVYAFYWSVDAPEGRVQTVLVKNGESQKYGPLTADITSSFSGTSSMSAVVECDRDDFVWVKVQSWPDEEACNIVEAKYSSFSGFKIYTSSDDPSASAFTAQLSQNATFPDSPHTIIYDTALVNIGNGYYPTNGSFVCREDGVHAFTVSAHRVSSFTAIYLQKNGIDMMYITYPRNTAGSSTDSGTSSGTAVLECVRGDVISVVDGSAGSVENLAAASSLSGYRLEDDQGVIAFTAVPSISRTYENEQHIDFDDVITNVGGGYFPGISTFICQDEALYVLSWGLWNYPEFDERSGEVRLIKTKDGERSVMKAGPRSSRVLSSSIGRSASTQAIVRCEQDAAFYIETVVESGSMTYVDAATYFSGFRLPSFT